MGDYNESIYNFMYGQMHDVKYAYRRDCNALIFKAMAEEHFGFDKNLALAEWELAFEVVIADVFSGGCEVEAI